jgi:fatty-acid peroxygenase
VTIELLAEHDRAIYRELGEDSLPLTRAVHKLLQDYGSVQLLEGEAHRHRKALFLAAAGLAPAQRLAAIFMDEWRHAFQKAGRVRLFDTVQRLLTRAPLRWMSLPVEDVNRRMREFSAMIENSGRIGPANWWAQILRVRSERWARDVIDRVREGPPPAGESTAAEMIAFHRDTDGRLLDRPVAAVELLNVLRPTFAVARFIVFVALALHEHPAVAARLRTGDERRLLAFVEEVRRFYPFFPFIGGRVKDALPMDRP